MRLGLFGGTFDPPHFGHLLLAEQCREQCALDEVWFIPASVPPHKREMVRTSAAKRVEMLKLATAGYAEFRVDERELSRDGPSFTVDTLESLHAIDPQRELFFLIGGDSLRDFPTWRSPTRILELATLVAVNRGDEPFVDSGPLEAEVGHALAARVQRIRIPGVDFSSTDIRRRVARRQSIRFIVPRAVEVYIQQHGLYCPDSPAPSTASAS